MQEEFTEEIRLSPATKEELKAIKIDLIKAFGKFCVGQYGIDGVDLIPPTYLLDESFTRDDQTLYVIKSGEERIGATLLTDMGENVTMVELFYLSPNHEKGLGTQAWQTIENAFPNTKLWKLLTPYCEKRNINFYINKCGFKITEYYNEYHRGEIMEEYDSVEIDYGGFFLFEKESGK